MPTRRNWFTATGRDQAPPLRAFCGYTRHAHRERREVSIRGLRPGGLGVSINCHPRVHRWTEVEDSPYTGGPIGLATELRNREKVLGTTIDSRRDLRIRYTEPASSPPAGVTNLDQYRNL